MTLPARLRRLIREVPDFPRPGILFRDITPLLRDAEALRAACDALADPFRARRVDAVVGIESRGFIFGAAVAYLLGAGFVPARKGGKLPWTTERERYELEYGTDEVEVHADAIRPGDRVLVVDDVIATGGTAAATIALVRRMGGEVLGAAFLLELVDLDGRKRLTDVEVHALLAL